ncbi:hypothetical protein BH24ACT19_BH24ACT19_00540 [soil metagenome]
MWILQTLPAIFLAMYVPWLDRWAILVGWLVGIVWGTYGMIQEGFANGGLATLELFGFSTTLYVAFYALVANLAVVFAGSALARLLGTRRSYGPLTGEDDKEPERA